ncbi:MAG: CTP synthase [Nitrososphaeria archaeon]|nr:CTP synthase [Nitrososphaeria archaeon]NIQ33172.1 CTP synthase [Nitrososphaeria archaeon]
MKYIFVTGGVMSGIGKGIITSSIAKILQLYGFKVTAIKIDPYLNYDAGTMNPYIHGEVFVCDDGTEVDMDLGTYQRFLGVSLSGENNITTGMVYLSVIEKERRGDLLGQCVQIIPHITNEIKRRIRSTSQKSRSEVVVIECGGTVGDIESQPFLEAFRQMRIEEPRENTASVHVTFVPFLETAGEQKTKPTQHSVQEYRRIGVQPDVIVARSKGKLRDYARKKIALFSNVHEENVFGLYDLDEIYSVPSMLEDQGFSSVFFKLLNLHERQKDETWRKWEETVKLFSVSSDTIKVAMAGKYVALADSYVSIREAIRHAAAHLGLKPQIEYIDTEKVEENPSYLNKLDQIDAVIIPGGFGPRGAEGKISVAEYALKEGIPYLGLCFGFQLAVAMFARSIGLENANSTEIDPDTPHPVIDLLPEQRDVEKMGGTMKLGGHPIRISKKTLAYSLYKKEKIRRRHRHRYFISIDYEDDLVDKGLCISGRIIPGGYAAILEIPGHPFFFATQYHPEFTSLPWDPDAAFTGLFRAAIERKKAKA